MENAHKHDVFELLKDSIRDLEGTRRVRDVLPFGDARIDGRLPGGGLALGAIHEIGGGGADVVHAAAAGLFAAGIAARTKGRVLWCTRRNDLNYPALAQVGLPPERLIIVEPDNDNDVLATFEEALRHGGLGAVVCELARLPMTESRRLQLAAERYKTIGLALRRWRRPAEAVDFGQPTAATTRWRVSSLPSEKLPVPGVGKGRWHLELLRAKAGECCDFEVEACDGEGFVRVPSKAVGRAFSKAV
jgi:protein ImuA